MITTHFMIIVLDYNNFINSNCITIHIEYKRVCLGHVFYMPNLNTEQRLFEMSGGLFLHGIMLICFNMRSLLTG